MNRYDYLNVTPRSTLRTDLKFLKGICSLGAKVTCADPVRSGRRNTLREGGLHHEVWLKLASQLIDSVYSYRIKQRDCFGGILGLDRLASLGFIDQGSSIRVNGEGAVGEICLSVNEVGKRFVKAAQDLNGLNYQDLADWEFLVETGEILINQRLSTIHNGFVVREVIEGEVIDYLCKHLPRLGGSKSRAKLFLQRLLSNQLLSVFAAWEQEGNHTGFRAVVQFTERGKFLGYATRGLQQRLESVLR